MNVNQRLIRTHRGAVGVAAVALAMTGVTAGGGQAAGAHAAHPPSGQLGYTCRFPSGPQQVGVRVTAQVPASVGLGKPVQPAGVTVITTIPQAALGDLHKQNASSVAATVRLAVKVAEGRAASAAPWSGLAAPRTPVPGSGNLALAASGRVPPMGVLAPGMLTFTAGALSMVLTPRTADGSATSPATVPVACTLDPGQSALLAAVPVTESPGARSHGSGNRAPDVHGVIGAASMAASPAQTPPPFNVDVWNVCSDPKNYPSLNLPLEDKWVSIYLAGYANARKLNGAATLGSPVPALVHAGNGHDDGFASLTAGPAGSPIPTIDGEEWSCVYNGLQLDYRGKREFPPVTATFMSFGFVPITATAYLTQAGSQPITAVLVKDAGPCFSPTGNGFCGGIGDNNGPYTVVSKAEMSLRIADVKVNGTPLDVGSNCHTVAPLSSPGSPIGANGLVLSGGSSPGEPEPVATNAIFSGAFGGFATIPRFTGCVTPGGDNLNALITSSVSGSGNFVKVITGNLCTNFSGNPGGLPGVCSPSDSKSRFPRPHFLPYWTVKHGGKYTAKATGPVTLTWNPSPADPPRTRFTITCSSASFAGRLDDVPGGAPRGSLGPVTSWRFGGCTGSGRIGGGSAWTITQQGTASFHGSYYCPDQATCADQGQGSIPTPATLGSIDGLSFVLDGTNVSGSSTGTCRVEAHAVPGVNAVYVNQSSTLAIGGIPTIGEPNLEITSTSDNAGSTCPVLNVPTGDPYLTPIQIFPASNYVLSPGGIAISSQAAP